MRASQHCFLVIAAVVEMMGTAQAQSAKEAIVAANAEFVKAYNAKDAAKVASFYDEDAAALPANDVRADGRANIQKLWQGGLDAGLTGLMLTTQEVEENGHWAYEVGTFTVKIPDKSGKLTDDVGKYIVVWKKGSNGQWYLHRDIWNDDPPKAQ